MLRKVGRHAGCCRQWPATERKQAAAATRRAREGTKEMAWEQQQAEVLDQRQPRAGVWLLRIQETAQHEHSRPASSAGLQPVCQWLLGRTAEPTGSSEQKAAHRLPVCHAATRRLRPATRVFCQRSMTRVLCQRTMTRVHRRAPAPPVAATRHRCPPMMEGRAGAVERCCPPAMMRES